MTRAVWTSSALLAVLLSPPAYGEDPPTDYHVDQAAGKGERLQIHHTRVAEGPAGVDTSDPNVWLTIYLNFSPPKGESCYLHASYKPIDEELIVYTTHKPEAFDQHKAYHLTFDSALNKPGQVIRLRYQDAGLSAPFQFSLKGRNANGPGNYLFMYYTKGAWYRVRDCGGPVGENGKNLNDLFFAKNVSIPAP